MKLFIYAKEFLAVHFAFDTFAHILWGSSKPVIVLTDNKSLTRFCPAKTIPSSLWTCVDHVLNFNFVLGNIPGKANAAADYLSRIHNQSHSKLELRFNSKIPVADVHLQMGIQVPDNSVNSFSFDCEHYTLPKDVHFSFPEINALHAPNPLHDLDVTDKSNSLKLYAEQQKDTNIKLVFHWLEKGPPPPTLYMNTELKKLIKKFGRLENHHGVLYRKSFDDRGRNFIRHNTCVRESSTEFTTANMQAIHALPKQPKVFANAFIFQVLLNF